jgi:hypothetical protein
MSVVLNIGVSKKVGQPNYSSLEVSCGFDIHADLGLLADEARLEQLIRQLYVRVFHSIEEQLKHRTVPGTYQTPYWNVAGADAVMGSVNPHNNTPMADPISTAMETAAPAPAVQPPPIGVKRDQPPLVSPSFGAWCNEVCRQHSLSLGQLMPWLYRYFMPNGEIVNDNRAMGLAIAGLGLKPEDWKQALEHLIDSLEPEMSA